MESMAGRPIDVPSGAPQRRFEHGTSGGDRAGGGGGVGLSAETVTVLDSSVGFAAPPAPAKLVEANGAVDVNSVVGAWAYQGSREAVSKGQVLNAEGHTINAVRASDGKQSWQT